MSQTCLGTTTPESRNLDCGASPPATPRADWDYPTTEVSAVELRARIAERRSKGAGSRIEHMAHGDPDTR